MKTFLPCRKFLKGNFFFFWGGGAQEEVPLSIVIFTVHGSRVAGAAHFVKEMDLDLK